MQSITYLEKIKQQLKVCLNKVKKFFKKEEEKVEDILHHFVTAEKKLQEVCKVHEEKLEGYKREALEIVMKAKESEAERNRAERVATKLKEVFS